MASVMIEVDLPPGVEITGYERHQDGHGFEVRWPLPERCPCQRCGHEGRARVEYKTSPQAVRDRLEQALQRLLLLGRQALRITAEGPHLRSERLPLGPVQLRLVLPSQFFRCASTTSLNRLATWNRSVTARLRFSRAAHAAG